MNAKYDPDSDLNWKRYLLEIDQWKFWCSVVDNMTYDQLCLAMDETYQQSRGTGLQAGDAQTIATEKR